MSKRTFAEELAVRRRVKLMREASGVSNRQRAEWAMEGLKRFTELAGGKDEDLKTIMEDYIANLKHLAHQRGLDWNILLHRADFHFMPEAGLVDDDHTWATKWQSMNPRTKEKK